MNGKEFMERFIGDTLEEYDFARLPLLLVQGRDVQVDFATSVEDALALAERNSGSYNVYFSHGLMPQELEGTNRRGEEKHVSILTGFGFDFDVDPHHGKFEGTEEIEDIIGRLDFPPTAVVYTGGGVHCHWAYDEAWVLETDAERVRAEEQIRGFHHYVKGLCGERRVDTTDATNRVWRIPGTINHKYDKPLPVFVKRMSPLGTHEFSPDTLDDLRRKKIVAVQSDKARATASAVVFHAQQDIPDWFPPLMLASHEISEAWHKRKNIKDKSMSGYNLSLGQLVASRTERPLQEISDLLVAHRVYYGSAVKETAHRITMNKIRIDEPVVEMTKEEAVDDEGERAIAEFGTLTGILLHRIQISGGRLDPEGVRFWLITQGTRVHVPVGGVEDMMSPAKMMKLRTLLSQVDRCDQGEITVRKRADRLRLCVQLLIDHCAQWVDADTPVDPRYDLAVKAWEYMEPQLFSANDMDQETKEMHMRQKRPFSEGGHLFLHVEKLVEWLPDNGGWSRPMKEIRKYLKTIGFYATKENIHKDGGGATSVRYYGIGHDRMDAELKRDTEEIRDDREETTDAHTERGGLHGVEEPVE